MNWFSYFKSIGACIYEVLLLSDLAGQLLRKCDCKLWRKECMQFCVQVWLTVCGLTRNFQEVQFLEIKKKGKKKTQKNNNCKMCLYEKSRWIYSLYAFLKSLKIQKSQHGKIYLHVRELDAMVWRTLHDHIFTSFLLKIKQLEFKHHQNTFFFI